MKQTKMPSFSEIIADKADYDVKKKMKVMEFATREAEQVCKSYPEAKGSYWYLHNRYYYAIGKRLHHAGILKRNPFPIITFKEMETLRPLCLCPETFFRGYRLWNQKKRANGEQTETAKTHDRRRVNEELMRFACARMNDER